METPKQDVPLDAMLAGPRPKPSQSKFKSERLAQAYFDDTRLPLPSLTPPTSLAPSAVLPKSTTGALRSAVRMGRLEGGQLVGNSDSEGGEDEGDGATNARTREFMQALHRGDVTNAGAAENSDALIAALETAYGAPPKQPQNSHPPAQSPPTAATPPVPASATPSRTTPVAQRGLKFKPVRAVPPPTIASNEGLREDGVGKVLEHGTALSAKSPSSAPTHVVSPPVPDSSASQLPMTIDSPSFAPPPGGGGDAPSPITTSMIIDSPSFQKPQVPIPSARQMRRPPVVQPSVRESSGTQRQQETSTHQPGQKMSRFKAQRAEP